MEKEVSARNPSKRQMCTTAAARGDLATLKTLRTQTSPSPWNAETCSCAAAGGHLDVVVFARTHDCPWDWWTCSQAAEYGHLELLKWAIDNDCPLSADAMLSARIKGHQHIIGFLEERSDRLQLTQTSPPSHHGHSP